jgi:hypothetical protein
LGDEFFDARSWRWCRFGRWNRNRGAWRSTLAATAKQPRQPQAGQRPTEKVKSERWHDVD